MPPQLVTNEFTYEGFRAGVLGTEGVHLGIFADTGLAGLSSPNRTTTLTDRAGHGRIPGAQWANERVITATVWTPDLATVMRFDAAMAPRPSPLDQVAWVGNFLGVGDQLLFVRPESCVWKIDQLASIGIMWRIDCSWTAADPTIFSAGESNFSFGGSDGVTSADLAVANLGLSASLSPQAWWGHITAHGTVTDPYIKNLDHDSESIRFTGLTMTDGQVLTIAVDRMCRVNSLIVNGKIRSNGQKAPNWPILRPTTDEDDDATINHIRIGAIAGLVSGSFHHRSTWSV